MASHWLGQMPAPTQVSTLQPSSAPRGADTEQAPASVLLKGKLARCANHVQGRTSGDTEPALLTLG